MKRELFERDKPKQTMPAMASRKPAASTSPAPALPLPVNSQKASTGKTKNVKPALKALRGICGTISGNSPATAMTKTRSTRQRSSNG